MDRKIQHTDAEPRGLLPSEQLLVHASGSFLACRDAPILGFRQPLRTQRVVQGTFAAMH